MCGRVHVTFGADERLGPAPHERRCVIARFQDRVHPSLRSELVELARRRGVAARRAAERIEPIVIVIDDPRHGPDRIVGRLAPPEIRHGHVGDIAFSVRVIAR
jgi:hypothetical protein